MRVRNCYRERISRVRSGYFDARKQARHHCMYLCFFSIADPDNGLLDEARSIFTNVHARSRGTNQHDTAGLTELEGGLGILIDKDFLDRSRRGCVIRNETVQPLSKRRQPSGKRRGSVRLNLSIGDVRQSIALSLNQPPPGDTESRVKTEDNHRPPNRESGSGMREPSRAKSDNRLPALSSEVCKLLVRHIVITPH